MRTLDALHLASFDFLHRAQTGPLRLASFDTRMRQAAAALGFPLEPLTA